MNLNIYKNGKNSYEHKLILMNEKRMSLPLQLVFITILSAFINVWIHGVVEGVLKEEVRSELSKIEGVEYFDADFREYGKGATAVELTYRS